MKNNWKLSVLFAVFVLLLASSTTKIIFAAETKHHKNEKHQYEVILPSDWSATSQQNSEALFSSKKDLMVLIHWETIPRSDSYGTYLLDEMNEKEQDIFRGEVESSFKKSMSSITFIQSEYVQMLNGHQAFVLTADGKDGPIIATILIRGNQTFFIIGRAESEKIFNTNKEVLSKIMGSFTIR